jgi:hypothetical protein
LSSLIGIASWIFTTSPYSLYSIRLTNLASLKALSASHNEEQPKYNQSQLLAVINLSTYEYCHGNPKWSIRKPILKPFDYLGRRSNLEGPFYPSPFTDNKRDGHKIFHSTCTTI